MTDGGSSWQPPHTGATPPPPAPGGFAPPTPAATGSGATSATATVEAAPRGGGRSTGKIVAATVGALAIVGAGVFAITRVSGDAAAGGADSPEAAGQALLTALDDEDALGAIDVLLPGERETLRQPMQDFVTRLKDWEVLSDDDLTAVSGVDVIVTDSSVEADATNVDDIVNLTITATVASKLDGEALPIGDWLRETVSEEDLAELDEETEPQTDSFPLTAVREDGRWYLSLFYSVAEEGRSETDLDIPAEPIALNGGDSPEAAMDNVVDALAGLDLTAMIGALNPNEFEALQRYAPLFLDDAQAEIDTAIRDGDVSIEVTDADWAVSGDGSQRSVVASAIAVEVSAEGETVTAEWADGCLLATVEGQEPIDSCASAGSLEEELDLDEVLEDPQAVEDAIADVQAAFADYENPGLIVEEVDGEWYLSPMATVSEQVLAVMQAISREEIEDLGDTIGEVIGTIQDQVIVGGVDVPDFDDFELPDQDVEGGWSEFPPEDTVVTDETSTDDTTVTDSTFVEAQCNEFDATEAQACYQRLVDSGEIDEAIVPWFFQHPECEAAEMLWDGEYYGLPDAEFIAFVESLQPCVQPLLASGELDVYQLGEIAKPECLQGVNPYASEVGDEAFDEFTSCLYD